MLTTRYIKWVFFYSWKNNQTLNWINVLHEIISLFQYQIEVTLYKWFVHLSCMMISAGVIANAIARWWDMVWCPMMHRAGEYLPLVSDYLLILNYASPLDECMFFIISLWWIQLLRCWSLRIDGMWLRAQSYLSWSDLCDSTTKLLVSNTDTGWNSPKALKSQALKRWLINLVGKSLLDCCTS